MGDTSSSNLASQWWHRGRGHIFEGMISTPLEFTAGDVFLLPEGDYVYICVAMAEDMFSQVAAPMGRAGVEKLLRELAIDEAARRVYAESRNPDPADSDIIHGD